MNVAVINLKDIIKYLIKSLIIFSLIFGLAKSLTNIKIQKDEIKTSVINKTIKVKDYSFLKCIGYSLSFFNNDNKKTNINLLSNTILELELGRLGYSDTKENIEEVKELDEISNDNSLEIGTNVTVEQVKDNNVETVYTNNYETVEIKNNSDYSLTEEILIPNVEIINNNEILIFHTHTCESYTSSETYNYEMTGNYRTTDLNYSVARVGEELANNLKEKGFNVTHNKTYHDYPAYSGSYTRSLETVSNLLNDKNTQIVFDIHRDALGSLETYAPTVKIDGAYVAQLMFVIGTDGGGLEHPNWKQNLKFAVKVQEIANKMYPGLFRPIILTNSRYNQHVTTGASIIEVGATGNTLDQCLLSMQCLSNVLEKALK